MSSTVSMSVCQPIPSSQGPCTSVLETRAHRLAVIRDRLMAGLTALRALLRQRQPSTWRMADSRGQERDPLSELARHLPLPPMSF
jgi:hypothetical protein